MDFDASTHDGISTSAKTKPTVMIIVSAGFEIFPWFVDVVQRGLTELAWRGRRVRGVQMLLQSTPITRMKLHELPGSFARALRKLEYVSCM